MSKPGIEVEVLLRSEDSDGRLAIVRNSVVAGWDGPPLHRHDFDEAFYVLDGTLTFALGVDRREASAGEMVFAPANAVHTFANLSDAAATYMLVITPGGFERYFDRLAAEARGAEPPATASLPYPPTEVVGPVIRELIAAEE